jgi:hypothetical protein
MDAMTTTRMMARSLVALFVDNSVPFIFIISMGSRGARLIPLYLCCARNVPGDSRIMGQISAQFGTGLFV